MYVRDDVDNGVRLKRGTIEHPKTEHLAELLSISMAQAVGHLEALFHFTAKYAMRGNIGSWGNKQIAKRCLWDGDPDVFVQALINANGGKRHGWIEAHSEHRLIVHDWHRHADESVKKTLKNNNESFVMSDESSTVPELSGTFRKSPACLSLSSPSLSSPSPVPEPAVEVRQRPTKTDEDRQTITSEIESVERDIATAMNRTPAVLHPQRSENRKVHDRIEQWKTTFGPSVKIRGRDTPIMVLVKRVSAFASRDHPQLASSSVNGVLSWMEAVIDGCIRGGIWPGERIEPPKPGEGRTLSAAEVEKALARADGVARTW